MKTMTIQEFINNYKTINGGHYFDRDTLKFFGERISEMKLSRDTVIKADWYGHDHECYELYSYQHNAPEGVAKGRFTYFDTTTYEQIF